MQNRRRFRLNGARALTLLLMAAAAALPVSPASAQSYEGEPDEQYSIASKPVTASHNGRDFRVAVSAHRSIWKQLDGGGNEVIAEEQTSVYISLSRVNDPDGVRKATQTQTYSFSLDDTGSMNSEVTSRPDHPTLASASVNTGTDMGNFGKMTFAFNANSDLKKTCTDNGGYVHRASRGGTLAGSLTLHTGTALFGTVKTLPTEATLQWKDNIGCPQYVPCTPANRQMRGFRTSDNFSISAYEREGATSATVMASRSLPLSGGSNEGRLASGVSATVPATNVTLADNLSTGTIKGAKGTWLSGTAVFDPSGTLSTYGANCGPGTGKTFTSRSRFGGVIKAGETPFKMDAWLGADPSLSGNPLNTGVSAYRSTTPE